MRNIYIYVFLEVFAIFLIPNINALRLSENNQRSLKRLLSSDRRNPLVLFVDLSKTKKYGRLDDVFGPEIDYEYENRAQNEESNNNAYYIQRLLKNIRQVDESDLDKAESPKSVLRSALRARCRTVDRCAQQCPPREPQCPINCQQIFDRLNLCPPPPTPDPCERNQCCKKPRCGRTMPPKWRF